jgi:signal transduction histidine kinase
VSDGPHRTGKPRDRDEPKAGRGSGDGGACAADRHRIAQLKAENTRLRAALAAARAGTAERLERSGLARFLVAIDGLEAPVVLYDAEDRLVACNRAWREMNATLPEACQPGFPFEDYVRLIVGSGRYPSAVGREEAWIEWRLARHRLADGPFEIERSNGRWYNVYDQRLEDGGTVVASIDITAHKESARLKNEFITTLSHEVRTPLTSIRGALGLIAGGAAGPLPEPVRRLVELASANTERMVTLVTQMLDVQRLESRDLAVSMEPLDLTAVVSRSIDLQRPLAERFGVRLQVPVPAPVPPVRGNADRLTQVMANLLSNAIRFTPAECTVTVAVNHVNDGVRISVTDSGPGIPEAFRTRVFEPFARGEQPGGERDVPGSGLGLSICKRIVEEHHGHIGFVSGPRAGTTFYVDLPAHGGNSVIQPDPFPPRAIPTPATTTRH